MTRNALGSLSALKHEPALAQWLILALALLVIGGIIGLGLYNEHRAIDAMERQRLGVEARIIDENLSRQLHAINLALDSIRSELPDLKAHKDGKAMLNRRLRAMSGAMPGLRTLGILDAGGTMSMANREELVGRNFREREYFQGTRQSLDPALLHVSGPFRTILGVLGVNLSKVILDERGEFGGVVTATLDPEYLNQLLGSVRYAPDVWSHLVHGNGKLFLTVPAQPGMEGADVDKPGSFRNRHLESGQSATVMSGITLTTGEERLMAQRTINPAYLRQDKPMTLAVSRDLASIFAVWRRDSAIRAGLFALLVLASALGLFFYQQRQRAYARLVADQAAERKRAQTELQASELRFRTVLQEIASVAVQGYGPDGTTLYWNKASALLYGYGAEEAIGKNLLDLIIPPEMRVGVGEAIAQMFASGRPIPAGELSLMRKDGSRVSVFSSHAYVQVPGKAAEMFCVDIDLTEQKQAEQRLERLLAEQRAMLDNELIGLVTLRDLKFVWANPAAEKMLGWGHGELAGISIRQCYSSDADYQALVAAAYPVFEKGGLFRSRVEFVRKDGGRIWVDVSGGLLDRSTGETLWGISNVTDQVKALKALERSNAELQQFTYTVSHDLRQPLRMISSYLQLLERALADKLDAEKREYLNFAVDGAKRLDQMLVSLLEYSRVGRSGEPSVSVECRAVLDEALLFLQPVVAEAQAEIRIEGEWPRIVVSRDEILRLLQNLIGNAVKFRIPGRAPEIVVTGEIVGREWRVCVTDNGAGIDPDQIGRLFQVFQRLHSRADYEGSGVGLALCRKIAERHHGRIWVESAGKGQGSRFCVALPLTQEAP